MESYVSEKPRVDSLKIKGFTNMKRKNFGKIVQKLRKQVTDFTQMRLNEELDLPEKTIERVEQGRVKKIDTELLVQLANIFNLTSMERKEFFFAAIEMDSAQIATIDVSPQAALSELVLAMKRVCFPTFVIDVYGDVIVANNTLLNFLNIREALERSEGGVDEYNMMRYVFEDDSIYKRLVGDYWQKAAIDNMTYFRRISLRYMAEPYYDRIFNALKQYKTFKEFWKLVALKVFIEEREGHDITNYEYIHPEYGHIQYIATSSRVLTTAGELYYHQYVPANEHTHGVFTQLRKRDNESCGVNFLATWPDKPI